MDNEDKKIYAALAAIAIFLLSGIVWFLCAGRSDVSDIRRGAQSVTEQLDRAAEAASNSQRAVGEIQKIERRDADLISGSEEILQRVQERGGTENQN